MEKSQNGQYFLRRNYKRSVGLRSAIEAMQFLFVPISVQLEMTWFCNIEPFKVSISDEKVSEYIMWVSQL